MKKVSLLFQSLLAVILLVSCSDDNNSSDSKVTATAESFRALQATSLKNMTQTATYNLDAGTGFISFTSTKGVNLEIPTNCLLKNGNAVTGEVTLNYVEIFDRSDMLVANKVTVGVDDQGNKNGLFTGGAFYITVEQDGTVLDLGCNYTLEVPSVLTDGYNDAMTMWVGNVDSDGNLTWENIAAEIMGMVIEDPNSDNDISYYAWLNKFNWVNIDVFWSYQGEKTNINVKAPEGYDNKNSQIYFAIENEKNTLVTLDKYENGVFSFSYSEPVPVGVKAHLIFTSEKNGQWLYAIKSVTTTVNQTIEFSENDLRTGSEEALINVIKALP